MPEEFYFKLLDKTLEEMGDKIYSMVIGPLRNGKEKTHDYNHSHLADVIKEKSNEEPVFNQLNYQDELFKEAPHRYDIKFDIFYKGVIQSPNIKKLYVLPNFENSEGTMREINFAKEAGKEIVYM